VLLSKMNRPFAAFGSLRGLWLIAVTGVLFWMVLPLPFILFGISPAFDSSSNHYFMSPDSTLLGFDSTLQNIIVGALVGLLILFVIARLQSFRKKKSVGYGLYFAGYIVLLQRYNTIPLLFSREFLYPMLPLPQLMYSGLLGILVVLLISPLFARLIPKDILRDSLSFNKGGREMAFSLKMLLFFFPPSLAYLYFSDRERWTPFLGRLLRVSATGLLSWMAVYYIWSQSFLIRMTLISFSMGNSALHSTIVPLLIRFGLASLAVVCVAFMVAYCLSRVKMEQVSNE